MAQNHWQAQAAAWVQAWRRTWPRPFARSHGLYLALPAHWPVLADDPAVLEEVLQAFEGWCEAHPGARCELALSAAATLWQVVQHEQAGEGELAQAWEAALEQWAHYLDVDLRQPEVMADWQLQEAHAPGYSLLAATPLALSAGLMDVAQRHGVQLQWLGPWWVRGLASWLGQMAGADPHDDAAWPAEQELILSEPGWSWRAHLLCREAEASVLPRWAMLRRSTPWVLSHLEVDGGSRDVAVSAQAAPSARRRHTVQLDAPGVHADQAMCVGVDLSVLQGLAPVWSPA
jgi:hypothetical protein